MIYEMTTAGKDITCTKVCPIDGKPYSLTIPVDKYKRWQNGEHIQKVFPRLKPEEKDFLITGFTPKEQDSIMGYEEEY